MSIVLPMVKESQTSGGTGNMTGCAAVTDFKRGDTAEYGAIDRRYKYWIREGALYERGIGYKSAVGTFVRETILGNSSGTTAAINFTSAAIIISMEQPGISSTFPSVYSEDGDGIGLLQKAVNRFVGTSNAIAADTLYCMPLEWNGDNPISELGFDLITAPVSEASVYIGFYSNNPISEPGEVLSETTITVGTGASGIQSAIISSPVLFRRCYMAIITTVALTPRTGSDRSFALPDAQMGSNADAPYSMITATSASPTALPDPPPTAWTPKQMGIDLPYQIAMYGG